jgi:CheY-like chemotaxis protein
MRMAAEAFRLDELAGMIEAAQRKEKPPDMPAPDEPRARTVLIVDDSPGTLGFLTEALEREQFTVLVALRGDRALTTVQHMRPDLVLMDAIMPELDGFETCRRSEGNQSKHPGCEAVGPRPLSRLAAKASPHALAARTPGRMRSTVSSPSNSAMPAKCRLAVRTGGQLGFDHTIRVRVQRPAHTGPALTSRTICAGRGAVLLLALRWRLGQRCQGLRRAGQPIEPRLKRRDARRRRRNRLLSLLRSGGAATQYLESSRP